MNSTQWALAGLTTLVLLGGWWLHGTIETKVDAKTSDAAFAARVATTVQNDPVLRQGQQSLVDESLSRGLADPELQRSLLAAPEIAELIDQRVATAAGQWQRSDKFAQDIRRLVEQHAPNTAASSVDAAQLAGLQTKINRYESQLAALTSEVNNEESATLVNAMQGQLIDMQSLISGLSQEVKCAVATMQTPRTFLLKERRTTTLAGHDLVITLGRLRRDVLETVSVSAPGPNRETGTKVIANVRLGQPVTFKQGDVSYEGTFTYRQARFGPDFVGFEIRQNSPPGSDCASLALGDASAT